MNRNCSRADIERAATRVHEEIDDNLDYLFEFGAPSGMARYRPEVAAHLRGLAFELHESLGRFSERSDRFEVAGYVDLDARCPTIRISTRFCDEVQLFTAAHEIGHYELHRRLPGFRFHRERPLSGDRPRKPQPRIEREANYFAACFLIPASALRVAFRARFGSMEPLPLTDDIANLIAPGRGYQLFEAGARSDEFEMAVATCTSFGFGRRFTSLARLFGVSSYAMAIRLREIGLVSATAAAAW